MVKLREDMVNRGVAFMRNPKVASTETSKKIAFLEGKGLTSAELAEVMKIFNSGKSASPATSPRPTSDSIAKAITALRAQLQPETERDAITAAITVLEFVLHQEQQKEEDAMASKHTIDNDDNVCGVAVGKAESESNTALDDKGSDESETDDVS